MAGAAPLDIAAAEMPILNWRRLIVVIGSSHCSAADLSAAPSEMQGAVGGVSQIPHCLGIFASSITLLKRAMFVFTFSITPSGVDDAGSPPYSRNLPCTEGTAITRRSSSLSLSTTG